MVFYEAMLFFISNALKAWSEVWLQKLIFFVHTLLEFVCVKVTACNLQVQIDSKVIRESLKNASVCFIYRARSQKSAQIDMSLNHIPFKRMAKSWNPSQSWEAH